MEFGFMDTIVTFLTTKYARFILICAIAATGSVLAFGETQGIMKRGVQACFGGSLIVGAISFVSALWGV
jgi:type IV secretory pathway VirB2 component (pilin)